MDQAKIEKQNGALKVILLLLFISGVSVVTILGYHYLPVLLKNSEPWEKKTASREINSKKEQKKEPSQSTTTSPNQTVSNPPPSNDPLQTEAGKFVGAWKFTGGKGTTYLRTYSSPRLENGNYVGDVADENNVTFAKYTVSAGNNLTLEVLITNALNSAGEKNTYNYTFSNNGNSFTLSRNGSVLSTWQRR